MKVFGICMVRDAEDIIGYIVEHMIEQVDHVIVADNLSTDKTRDILEWFGSDITLVEDNDPAYRQSEKMTALAMLAKKLGAEWVVPFDADEWWYSDQGRLADVIRDNNYSIYTAKMYDHRPSGVDGTEDNPMKRIGWRCAEYTPLHKVACRVRDDLVIQMGNHSATYTTTDVTTGTGFLEIRHYPYRNAQQFIDKAVVGAMALELTDLPHFQGAHWRDYYEIYKNHGPEALADVFRQYFWTSNPADEGFIFDPVIP